MIGWQEWSRSMIRESQEYAKSVLRAMAVAWEEHRRNLGGVHEECSRPVAAVWGEGSSTVGNCTSSVRRVWHRCPWHVPRESTTAAAEHFSQVPLSLWRSVQV